MLIEVSRFLRKHGMSDNRFSLLVGNSSELMRRIRRGAELRPETIEKVRKFMREYDAEHPL
jgi:predicted transcriptional regulator